ncbi:MAG: SDR family oxidoreductase [Planctomycetaceae bacterium]|nr:SDR family oxidoreductase [Planctomycetaceae bacterium]
MLDFTGKTVLVTGAGSGIGEAICIEFGALGANVAASDIDMKAAQAVADKVDASGKKSVAIQADVSDEKQVKKMVAGTLAAFGRIDVLINNAGIIDGFKHTIDLTVEEWDHTFAVNTRGVFLGCREVIPQMLKQGGGRIINAASQMGKTAGDIIPHYSGSKAAVILLTKTLAKEYAEKNITVNCICPGSVDTPMTAWEADQFLKMNGTPVEESYKTWISAVPMKRLAIPRDLAKGYVFLASELADYVTGQAINICGGQEMH